MMMDEGSVLSAVLVLMLMTALVLYQLRRSTGIVDGFDYDDWAEYSCDSDNGVEGYRKGAPPPRPRTPSPPRPRTPSPPRRPPPPLARPRPSSPLMRQPAARRRPAPPANALALSVKPKS